MADKGINTAFKWVDPIYNNLFLSINVQQGDQFWNPTFGTKLNQIKKASGDSANLARDQMIQATKWMLEVGKVKAIDIQIVVNGSRFDITATVTKNDGTVKPFALWYDVI